MYPDKPHLPFLITINYFSVTYLNNSDFVNLVIYRQVEENSVKDKDWNYQFFVIVTLINSNNRTIFHLNRGKTTAAFIRVFNRLLFFKNKIERIF